jgi:hypothetical protein
MRRRQFIPLLFPALVAALSVVGCGPADPVGSTVPVRGRIMVGDKPLTAGRVEFLPDAAKGNPSKWRATGTVDAEGNYELTTEVEPGVTKPGARTGWYRVAVFPYKEPPPGQPPEWLASSDSTNPDRTLNKAEVRGGAPPGAYDFTLNPPSNAPKK